MKIKAYSKITLVLQIYKKQKHEIKHKINGVFALYKKMYDEINIKIFKNKQEDKIRYYLNNKFIKIQNCSIKKMLVFLRQKKQIPYLEITINKKIPICSGLGGSAVDAGAITKYLIEKYKIFLSKNDFEKISLLIGSDVPFFIKGYDFAQVKGYGNLIKKISKPALAFDVISTNIPISSKQAYDKFDKEKDTPSPITNKQINDFLYKAKNISSNKLNSFHSCVVNKNKKLLNQYKLLCQLYDKAILSGSGGSFVVILN